jgi:glycerophosphodiester phosphodiesterase
LLLSHDGNTDHDTGLRDTVDQAIKSDDVPILKETLLEANLESGDVSMQKLFANLLQRSISCKSKECIAYLLKEIETLEETGDINGRNCLHRLVIAIGRAKTSNLEDQENNTAPLNKTGNLQFITPAASPPVGPASSTLKESVLLSLDDEYVRLLDYVLTKLEPRHRKSLMGKDTFGRFPLHYAAQFGFVVICELVMKYMQDWGQFNVEHGIDAPEWQDNEGLAPLHLSVIGGHPLTTQALLRGENWKGKNNQKAAMRRDISKSSAVLALATKSNFTVIVKLLVEAGVDINWQDATGETALHVAARFGHHECAEILLAGTNDQKANFELTERSFSWTPLHVACVDGRRSIVELLISVGAELNKLDASGWTAREHAALRGHMDIAERLAECTLDSGSDSGDNGSTKSTTSTATSSLPAASSMEALRSQVASQTPRVIQTTKTFGHRYLTNENMILVSLGSMVSLLFHFSYRCSSCRCTFPP